MPICPGDLFVTLLTQVAVDNLEHGKKGEVSEPRYEATVLFNAGEKMKEKKLVYIKDTESLVIFKTSYSHLEV